MSTRSDGKFKKDNQWQFKRMGEKPLNSPLTIRLTEEQREQIKKLPGWQGLLRDYIDELIKNNVDGT